MIGRKRLRKKERQEWVLKMNSRKESQRDKNKNKKKCKGYKKVIEGGGGKGAKGKKGGEREKGIKINKG